MTAIRRLMLACVLTLGTMATLGTVPSVEANSGPKRVAPPVRPHKVHRHHGNGHTRVRYVYYRTSPDSPWVCYGGYYSSTKAASAATYFRSNGYDAFVR